MKAPSKPFKTDVHDIDIGIDAKQRKAIADGLSHLWRILTVYLKTHNYHWNVTDRCSTRCI
jgi:DNA-binding ferritin-like protein